MSGLELHSISKAYPVRSPNAPTKDVLRDVDLSIAANELAVLLGVSGSGKSTILRIVAGLIKPDRGTVIIGGQDVTTLEARKRSVAMVFQDGALYPTKSVFQNLSFGLEVRRIPPAQIRREVHDVALSLDLDEEYLRRYPSELSGGERQRVALGRALLRDPKVLLLDEPLSSVDAPRRSSLRNLILNVRQRLAVPAIHVTHDQEEAMAIADRLLVLDGGTIIQQASPDVIYDRPASLAVARLIGSPPMQILRGQLVRQGDALKFVSPYISINLGSRRIESASSMVFLGVRPESISLAAVGNGHADGEVARVELLSGASVTHVTIGNGCDLAVRGPRHAHARSGDRVAITVDPHNVSLFDADSEQALTCIEVGG